MKKKKDWQCFTDEWSLHELVITVLSLLHIIEIN